MTDDLTTRFDRFLQSIDQAGQGLNLLASKLAGTAAEVLPQEAGDALQQIIPQERPSEALQQPLSRLTQALGGLEKFLASVGFAPAVVAQEGRGVFSTMTQPSQPQPNEYTEDQQEDRGILASLKDILSRMFDKEGKKAFWNVWDKDTERFEAERFGDVVSAHGKEAKAVGQWMSHVGVPGGGVVEKGGEFVDFLGESVENLRKWNDMLMRSNFQFAEFSAGMAQVQAEQERFDINQSRQRGDRRAESAQYLAEGRRGLEQKFGLGEDVVANQKNWFMGYVDKKINEVIDSLFPKALQDKLAEWLGVNLQKAGDMDMNEWQQQIADDHVRWDQERGRPNRFPRR